jgi:hypothetical protein
MTRILRGRVQEGDTASAVVINATYDDYSQPGAIDKSNVRDQAFDLPHFNSDVKMLIRSQTPVQLGTGNKSHNSTPNTVPALVAGTATHIVRDGGGIPTFMNFTANPWVLEPGDCLRVWWNLSMRTVYTGFPWNAAGAMGRYVVDGGGVSPPVTISDGFHCWLAWLEWDITSAALVNWAAVPGQTGIQTGINGTGLNGIYTKDMSASTPISPWILSAVGNGVDGYVSIGISGKSHEWFAPYSMYVDSPPVQATVYGVRLVIAGVFHTQHFSGGNAPNALVLDYDVGANVSLEYTTGRMSAVQMRMG